jgi:hypothetical protein
MRKLTCLAFLAALAAAGSVHAMSYGLLPLADGSSAIVARGVIGVNETARFVTAMGVAQAHGAMPRTLIISSGGGSLKNALEVGRVVRQLRMHAVVASVAQDADGQRSLTPGECHSACVMVLMGGFQRTVLPGSRVSVHSPQLVLVADGRGYTVDDKTNRAIVRRVEPALRSYARAMGVSPAVIDVAHGVPHSSARTLNPSELVRFGLVTSGPTERARQNPAGKRAGGAREKRDAACEAAQCDR